ncbi:hypothetical protein DJ568_04420 [Mucilaginibacter hurinus]|uniref:Outer membrane protein beta-barrel domain-containing protein n=1 Tax=Mucilaginibacter hurinus TaxID=2201324 RepID=A0A367GS93_9SPHI|nr:hypothetical protein [Mucilaginibacter hurinus]RCH55998.1 hypothetical protein DJ568_04420 [Mucilaginibacter hurinus]
MKSTTKLIASALTAVAILFGTNVNAQTTEKSAWRMGVGIEGGIPVGGNISDNYGFVLGGNLRLQYGISDNTALTLTSGYSSFFGKEREVAGVTVKNDAFGVVPVKLGVKAFFTDNLYFGAEGGAGFITNKPNPGDRTKLILTPTLGWADQSWDVGVKYDNYSGQGSNFGTIGLRVAYGFGL